jgi:hypothetical protein
MENNKFIAQDKKVPIEEVREIENQEQKKDESKGSKVIEKLEETILPTVHASGSEEKTKEGLKKLHSGAIKGSGVATGTATLNPVIGAGTSAVAGGIFKGLGEFEKGIGEITDSKELKETGEVHSEGADKALKK